jgi:hypothetical protein
VTAITFDRLVGVRAVQYQRQYRNRIENDRQRSIWLRLIAEGPEVTEPWFLLPPNWRTLLIEAVRASTPAPAGCYQALAQAVPARGRPRGRRRTNSKHRTLDLLRSGLERSRDLPVVRIFLHLPDRNTFNVGRPVFSNAVDAQSSVAGNQPDLHARPRGRDVADPRCRHQAEGGR